MKSSALQLEFPCASGKKISCSFDGGDITSDAGLAILSAADKKVGLTDALARQIRDDRQLHKVTHSILEMSRERIYSIAMGYEDANDLDDLRNDSALKAVCSKHPLSEHALASQPTVSRLENSVGVLEMLRMALEMASVVVAQLPEDTSKVVLDIDATDDPCHGQQELMIFDGHYREYCYIPLYMHITDEQGRQRLLGTLLRSASARSTKGVISFVKLAVRTVRERFPDAEIILRGDCGFGYGGLMDWCDANRVNYTLGLQPTTVKKWLLPVQMEMARMHKFRRDGHRHYEDFEHQAKTWPNARRVIAKLEVSSGVVDTRCVVTNEVNRPAQNLYKWYTERGDRENRIKEMKLDISSGRTSCHRFLANQFRLLLHTAACVLMGVVQHALEGTRWAKAQVGTVRLRILKVGARVVQTCRRVWFHLPNSFPDKDVWCHLCNKFG